jgi:hypothetical protein
MGRLMTTYKPHDSHGQQMTPELQRVIDAADKRERDKAAMPSGCTTPTGCRENGCHGECLPTDNPEAREREALGTNETVARLMGLADAYAVQLYEAGKQTRNRLEGAIRAALAQQAAAPRRRPDRQPEPTDLTHYRAILDIWAEANAVDTVLGSRDRLLAKVTRLRDAMGAGVPLDERQAATPAPAERATYDIELDGAEALALRALLGEDEGEPPTPIRLQVGPGHGGFGLYASSAEYPDDGAFLLAPLAAPPATPAAQPADGWTITAPDGQQWSGPTPFKAASAARLATISEEEARASLARLQACAAQEAADMQAEHEHLNCPACGGSGHVEDARAGWIAVADRLPEPDAGEVLVWLTGGRCAFDEWHMHREDPIGMGGPTLEMGYMWRDYDFEEITHWRPLPAAPALEGQG